MRRLFVESDSESLEFVFDDFFVLHGPSGVEDDNDEIAGSGHCNDLSSSSFSVFGSFDDSRQIQQLYFSSFVIQHSWYTGERGELICCDFREGS